jgi:tight adherence protein C
MPNDPLIHYLLMIVGVLGSVAAYTATHRMFTPAQEDETELSKLAKKEVGTTTAFSSLNPNGSLIDRLDLFLLRVFHLDVKLEELHMMMGRPAKPTPLEMLHLKELMAGGLMAFFWFISGSAVFGMFGFVAFFIPDSLFQSQIQKRQFEIMKTFPTFVDLAALTIEAGLDYMSAIERILKNSKQKSELENELQKVINEIQLGYSRKDALKRLALRTGIQEIRSFVGLIVQSDELGTSLVELLRNYGADMRFRRLNKAEKLAAQASTKMLIPLFVFIFPTVFIMMLAPMAKSLISGGLGF